MRRLFVRLHRWFGLFAALFLFVAGSTGAIIAWSQELDSWLNPKFHAARSGTTSIQTSALELVDDLEEVFRLLVAKSVEDRYQSMTEVVAALERLAAGQPPRPRTGRVRHRA